MVRALLVQVHPSESPHGLSGFSTVGPGEVEAGSVHLEVAELFHTAVLVDPTGGLLEPVAAVELFVAQHCAESDWVMGKQRNEMSLKIIFFFFV